MNKFLGPCLPHCFNKYIFFYIIIGIFLGYLINSTIKKNKKNN